MAEDHLKESLELNGTSSQEALQRALDMLLERLLCRPERRERTVRAITLSAQLTERGSWSERVTFRQALSDRKVMLLALGPRLGNLPAPAQTLTLAVASFGPAVARQQSLIDDQDVQRASRVREAVGQLRALAGPAAALRVAPVEPDSRIPERRFAFTPFSP
jgi:protein ImuB